MKTQVSPVVAAVVIVVVLAVVGAFIFMRAGTQQKYGAEIPPQVLKEFHEKGPRPMGPIPMPGGPMQPQGGAIGPPTGAKK